MTEGRLVFISASSADCEHAEQVCDFLESQGVPVFLSSRSLPELGDSDYRKVIDEQLDLCRHMVVVASSRDHVESPWVEAEWGFFINAKRARTKTGNIVTVTVGGLAPGELPPSLRYYEVVPLAAGALERLLKYVDRPTATPEAQARDAAAGGSHAVKAAEVPSLESLSGRGAVPRGARIKIFGIGGAGGAVLDLMISGTSSGTTTVLVTTDAATASASRADVAVLIGADLLGGLGAGSDHERARQAAEHDADKLRAELSACDLVVLSAGLGGGTGTGATPVLARLAREMKIVTVCFASLPFAFEGRLRVRKAQEALSLLQSLCDVLIPIPCDRVLRDLAGGETMAAVFATVAGLHQRWVSALHDLVQRPGMVNIDFADLRGIFRSAGLAGIGQGEAYGPNRARDAVRMAASSGYLSGLEVKRAQSVLLLVEGGPALALPDLSAAAEALSDECNPEANIVIGNRLDPDLGDAIRAIIIATRFGAEQTRM